MPTKTTALLAAVALLAAAPARAQGSPQPGPPALTYDAALQLATARNPGLEAARRQRAIREAQVRAAGQIPNPGVAFEASRDVPHEALTFDVPIELGGQRGHRIALAQAEALLADVGVQAELRVLRRNLRQSFYGLLAADERIRLSEEILALATRLREVAQARFEEGDAPRLDVLQADLGVARARGDLDLARSGRASAQADLNAVLNQPAGQALSVAGDLAGGRNVPDLASATTLAVSSNPDILQAQQEAAVEEQRVGLLKAERVPTPSFSVGGVFDAPGEYSAGWAGGVNLAIPLFSRNQGEIAASEATASQLRARLEAERRTVENGVFAAIARIEAQRRQVETYRDSIVPAASELASLAEESYRMGRDPVLALLDAQRSLRDVRREYLQAQVEFQSAVADLEEVIGAGIQ